MVKGLIIVRETRMRWNLLRRLDFRLLPLLLKLIRLLEIVIIRRHQLNICLLNYIVNFFLSAMLKLILNVIIKVNILFLTNIKRVILCYSYFLFLFKRIIK